VRRAAILLVCCCACLGGKQPQYDYFVLTPTRALAEPARDAAQRSTVGVSQVTIPGYLDRESIVTRTDDHRVVYSKRDRWAEPLDQAFERSLRHELAAALAPVGITVPSSTSAPTYDVQVDLLRFERLGASRVELWARWTLRMDTKLVHAGETRIEVRVAGSGDGAAAAALSGAIARLATVIAAKVQIAEAGLERQPQASS